MVVSSPRAAARGYKPAPLVWGEPNEHRRLIAEVVNNLLEGKINATGTFTLAVNSLTTTVKERRCGPNSVILQCPATENAGGEVGIWYSSRGVESGGVPAFVVNHGFDSRSDRTFAYAIFG